MVLNETPAAFVFRATAIPAELEEYTNENYGGEGD